MIKQNFSEFIKSFPNKHEWHLDVLEKVNPCLQSYYVKDSSYFIEYKIDLKIFNFSKGLKLKVPANVVGYPFSVCEQGFNKAKRINMGQTADETKLKVGCVEKTKYMYCYHSNKLLNKLIHYLLPYFSFKPYPIEHHVFRR